MLMTAEHQRDMYRSIFGFPRQDPSSGNAVLAQTLCSPFVVRTKDNHGRTAGNAGSVCVILMLVDVLFIRKDPFSRQGRTYVVF